MTFDEVLEQVRELLQSKGRVAYRALKRRFELDEEYLEDLKAELIDAEHVAHDEDGKVLVWQGSTTAVSSSQPLASQTAGPESRTPHSLSSQTLDTQREAERRQLTVMFCDVVGSTALSTQLDPEELREVEREYQRLCGSVINRFGGHLAKYLGDGLLVYFGYPVAHEDDAARAVRAGLEIVEKIPTLRTPSPVSTGEGRGESQLQVRIGIHTGLVVAGEMGTEDQPEHLAIVGETPNLAARIQGQANPDEVVISAATYRLVEGLFACEDRGQPALKGVSTPLTLYRVVKEEEARSRFEVVVRKGLTPLIGRDEEVGVLRERWAEAKQGNGQVVLLSGEPGIGKSRLGQVLKEHVAQDGAIEIEFRCSPYYQNSALYPIIDHMQQVLQFQRDDSSEAKLRKLETAFVGAHGRAPLPETVPLLAALLSLPHLEGYPPITLSPQKQKQRTQEALVAWLIGETERNTVVNIWEDLHWADPSTLELLQLYLDQVPTKRILTLLTFRPEFRPPWPLRSYMSQLMLGRLSRTQVEEMVAKVTSDKALPTEIVQQIVTKTDGVPLFVEEFTKTVVESIGSIGSIESVESIGSKGKPGRSVIPLGIPATLQDALMARLDRLGDAKTVAQLGATLGREFSCELLQAVSPLTEEKLQRELHRLVEAELVYQHGLPPQARYVFKHALIQDTAYQSLLKSTRRQYHQQIAQVLTDRFPATVATQPELVAHHYTEASLIAQALPHWQQAGERAAQRSAYVEAIAHCTKGLELLQTLPDTPARTQQELRLQLALAGPLVFAKGWAAPEVERVHTRALELCRQVEETPELFRVLRGLHGFYLTRAGLKTTREMAEQCLSLAQNVHNPIFLAWAHFILGQNLFWLGEFAQAREHLEEGIALYDPQQHRSYGTLNDPGVARLSYAAWTLWVLGYPDQALKRIREALTLAQGLSHPYSLAMTLSYAAMLHQFRREGQAAQERAEAAIKLCTEQGIPHYLALGTIWRGWALAEQGQGEEGLSQIRQGLAAWQAMGAELSRPYLLALLAEAYGRGGQVEEGLTVLAEALVMVDKNGERQYEAELYRLKGELTLAQSRVQGLASRVKEAEGCFLKAIEIARRQQAKSLELRAVMSLSRLWQRQGKRKEAHRMLAEIYGWFTGGFDTKDLQEAKALLDELS
jgi:class 3 adenylate cyclase/predicted ATPase